MALGASKDQWFKLEWAASQKIGGLVFTQPDRYTLSMNVEALEDGKWVRVAHAGPPDAELGINFCVTFKPIETTAIRLVNIDSTNVGGAAYYEVEVYSDPQTATQISNRLDVAAAGDVIGQMVGTVSMNNGRTGVVGASVAVSGTSPLGPWTRETVSKANGVWVISLPLNPTGAVTIAATQGTYSGQLSVEAMDVAQRLTPRPTDGCLSLEGTWDFLPDPPARFQDQSAGLAWKQIKVPSNYEMQGFTAKTDTAGYHKVVTIPQEWRGKPIRLRAEAIYSSCDVWLNGQRVGSHDGGATPFELDLSAAAKPGQANDLCILVKARSRAAMIDNMSVYAYFEIAGIWRPLELFCVEPVHVARLTYSTAFDQQYKDAELAVDVKVVNEQAKAVESKLALTVLDPAGKVVELDGLDATVSLGPWEAKTVTLKTSVKQPTQWNAELPRMYTIVAKLDSAGQDSAKIEQPLGFRQVEIKGRAFTINGKPVRLFGACLHAADPLMGLCAHRRARSPGSGVDEGGEPQRHSYVPLPAASPDGRSGRQAGAVHRGRGAVVLGRRATRICASALYIGIVSQYVERDRNHPSVVYWSTCNESNYGIIFQLAHRYVKQMDPTRPVGGTYAPEGMDNDVFVIHHPTNTHKDIERTKNFSKPVFYDECLTVFHGWGDFAHSLELDPGMHDYWETGVFGIRRQIMAYENQVGAMHWAWVDDAFLVPGRNRLLAARPAAHSLHGVGLQHAGRGYQGDCVWGVVDGWRRPRPEWWLMKKIYTPVLIEEKPLLLPETALRSPFRLRT